MTLPIARRHQWQKLKRFYFCLVQRKLWITQRDVEKRFYALQNRNHFFLFRLVSLLWFRSLTFHSHFLFLSESSFKFSVDSCRRDEWHQGPYVIGKITIIRRKISFLFHSIFFYLPRLCFCNRKSFYFCLRNFQGDTRTEKMEKETEKKKSINRNEMEFLWLTE